MAESSTNPAKRGRGRPRAIIAPLVRIQILDLLANGIGRRAVCHQLKLGYRTFLREFAKDPDFADQVVMLEAKRAEDCAGFLYQVAVGNYPPENRMRAAVAYLARKDRVDAARFARREAARKAKAKEG